MSASWRARKDGAPAEPLGAANTVFAVWLVNEPVSVPEPVTGEPVTLNTEPGSDRATLVTEPAP